MTALATRLGAAPSATAARPRRQQLCAVAFSTHSRDTSMSSSAPGMAASRLRAQASSVASPLLHRGTSQTPWLSVLDMFFVQREPKAATGSRLPPSWYSELSDVNFDEVEEEDAHDGLKIHSHLADRLAMQPIREQ